MCQMLQTSRGPAVSACAPVRKTSAQRPSASRNRSASMAARQPAPAAVMAWR
jgi:hypothetical protein